MTGHYTDVLEVSGRLFGLTCLPETLAQSNRRHLPSFVNPLRSLVRLFSSGSSTSTSTMLNTICGLGYFVETKNYGTVSQLYNLSSLNLKQPVVHCVPARIPADHPYFCGDAASFTSVVGVSMMQVALKCSDDCASTSAAD